MKKQILPANQHQTHVSGKHLLQPQQDAGKKKERCICIFGILDNMFKLKCFFQYDNKTGLFENCATPSPYDICYSISLKSEKEINKKDEPDLKNRDQVF